MDSLTIMYLAIGIAVAVVIFALIVLVGKINKKKHADQTYHSQFHKENEIKIQESMLNRQPSLEKQPAIPQTPGQIRTVPQYGQPVQNTPPMPNAYKPQRVEVKPMAAVPNNMQQQNIGNNKFK